MDRISANDLPKSECLGCLSDGIYVYEVDGNHVRNTVEVAWIGGGHYLEDDFIAENEIWVEEMPDEEDEEAIMSHEVLECMLMKYAKMEYPMAHELANSFESLVRGNEGELDEGEEEKGTVEEDAAEGTKHEAEEHGMDTATAEKTAMEHEEEHPMYYDKLEKAGLGKKVIAMMGKRGYGKMSPIPSMSLPKPANMLAKPKSHKEKVAIMLKMRKGGMGKASPKEKVALTMGEFKRGTLHSGSKEGPKVTNRKQAVAIALSQARKAAA